MPFLPAIRCWITRHQLRLTPWGSSWVYGRRLATQQRLLLRAIDLGLPLVGDKAGIRHSGGQPSSLARWLVETDHTRHPRIARAAIDQLIRENHTCNWREAIAILLHFLFANPDFQACKALLSNDGFWKDNKPNSGAEDPDFLAGYLYHARLNQIPDYLDLFATRFKNWTPACMVSLSRSLDDHLDAIHHLPAPEISCIEDRLQKWLDTVLPAGSALAKAGQIEGILFDGLPDSPSLAQRRIFRPIAARVYPMVEKLQQDVGFLTCAYQPNPGMVKITADRVRQAPWASKWQHVRTDALAPVAVLFGAHPFWSQCHPDALLGDHLQVTLPAGLPVKAACRL